VPRGSVISLPYQRANHLADPPQASLVLTDGPATINWHNSAHTAGQDTTSPAQLPQDVVLRNGYHVALPETNESGWTVPLESLADAGQYIQSAQLSETQQLRQLIYRSMFDAGADETSPAVPQGRLSFTPRPKLLMWRDQTAIGLLVDGQPLRRGQSLVAQPLKIVMPERGETIVVPDSIVAYQVLTKRLVDQAFPERDLNPVTNFDLARGRFLPSSQAGSVVLAFTLPAELLPFEVRELRFAVDLPEAARRKTTSVLLSQDGETALGEPLLGPGTLSAAKVLNEPRVIDDDQPLVIAVHVERDGGGAGAQWLMERPRLILTGQLAQDLNKPTESPR